MSSETAQDFILTYYTLVQDRTKRRSTTKLNCGLRFSYWHPISLGYRYNNSFLLEAYEAFNYHHHIMTVNCRNRDG